MVMNSKKVMGSNVNKALSNIAGILVVLVAFGLGIRSLLGVFRII
jgi:Mn2+/Fe2+ NRAMP family transporter